MHASATIQRNIETRPSNVHIHSTKITYVVYRHIARPIRLKPVNWCRVVKQCALFGGGGIEPRTLNSESETYPIQSGLLRRIVGYCQHTDC